MEINIPWAIKKIYLNHLNLGNSIKSPKSIFTDIYNKNAWRSNESVSGPGSTLEFTTQLRTVLPRIFEKYDIKSVVDAPCGDFNWMKEVDRSVLDFYIGVDVVSQLIAKNKDLYEDGNTKFQILDITSDTIPRSDLIICRDCLFHFSNKDIFKTLTNFKNSGASYLLTTTHTDVTRNKNIITGGFSLVNLEQKPFNFPKALEYLDDRGKYPAGHVQYNRKLGLWKLADL